MIASSALRRLAAPLNAAFCKAHLLRRRQRFTGAYPDFTAALQSVPAGALPGYDHAEVVEVSLSEMRQVAEWDYPVLFWLERSIARSPGQRIRLLDAGGHVGTKYFAFRTLVDLGAIDWVVWDLPAMVTAGQQIAIREGVTEGLSFYADLEAAGAPDILLCSGLLQYLDRSFTDLVDGLADRPPLIILNKVALRDGPTAVTLERIGRAYVPYQMRSRDMFLREIDALGYDIIDSWSIKALSNRIASHPELGASESQGFVLSARA